MAITIEKIGEVKNKLGEGPVWDVAEKALYWIDGGAPAIYRLDPKTNDIKSWQTPKPIGSFALREKGGAVLALSDGFYLFDFESGEAKQIGEPAAKAGTTFNDGKTDARGRFITGTLDSKFAQPIGSIFSLDESLKCAPTVHASAPTIARFTARTV
jgi:L-arabinonolactonase